MPTSNIHTPIHSFFIFFPLYHKRVLLPLGLLCTVFYVLRLCALTFHIVLCFFCVSELLVSVCDILFVFSSNDCHRACVIDGVGITVTGTHHRQHLTYDHRTVTLRTRLRNDLDGVQHTHYQR